MFRCIIVLVFQLLTFTGHGQYYSSPEVTDGFYPTRETLFENRPILPKDLETSLSVDSPDFFVSSLNQVFLQIKSENSTDSIRVDTLFAVALAGVPYIQVQGEFYRCITFGRLCYFATIQPLSGRSVATGASMSIGPWGTMAPTNNGNNMANEEFVFDLKTGDVRVLNYKTLVYFIQADEKLLNAYNQLKKREKRNQKYIFIKRFNENHPLRFFD